MSNQANKAAYAATPYASGAYPQSHPDRLGGVGRLFGLGAADPGNCRVLELGCADGSNLLPMCCELPHSEFVGIDLSEAHVDAARSAQRACAIPNVEFHAGDILDVDRIVKGTFDYVIVHGIYSWVPEEVKRKIIDACGAYLSADGVAYVSYNVLPGWSELLPIREAMLYHAAHIEDPARRAAQCRALARFLSESARADEPYARQLQMQASAFADYSDAYFLHDWLAPHNDPVYFHHFVAAARSAGLQYLGDSILPTMFPADLSEQARESLRGLSGDQVRLEQYLDFMRNRRFRHTLLCRADRELSRDLTRVDERPVFFGCPLLPEPDAEPDAERFRHREGGEVTIRNALARRLLGMLCDRYPETLTFAECLACVVDGAGSRDGDAGVEELRRVLAESIAKGLVDVSARRLEPGKRADAMPAVHAYARLQSRQGYAIVNRMHQSVPIDPLSLLLVRHMDGATDHEGLVDIVTGAIGEGQIVLEDGDSAVAANALERDTVRALVEQSLERLRKAVLTT